MPTFTKKILSLFLRTGCPRQLLLYLYNDEERDRLLMPPRQTQRGQVGIMGRAGYAYQDRRVGELDRVFGPGRVFADRTPGRNQPAAIPLDDYVDPARPDLAPYTFLVEARYEPNTPVFRQAVGFDVIRDGNGQELDIGAAIPDIIQSLPPRAAGPLPFNDARPEFDCEVLPDGSIIALPEGDTRIRLRAIDVKLASEPGPHYFAEVVYYSMSLAGWLRERGLDDRYAVVAVPAVWPGSHDASHVAEAFEQWHLQGHTPSLEELATALEEDLEIAPVDALAPRVRGLLTQQLPAILATPWQNTPLYVNFLCQGCEFLGYPWRDRNGELTNDDRQCWPTAEREGHLSRVPGLTRGSSRYLAERGGIDSVGLLARTDPEGAAFVGHHGLRARRTVFPSRALSLETNTTGLIPNSGISALMPNWPALRFYVFVDYDLSTAITLSFGVRAYWREPLPFGTQLRPRVHRWREPAPARRNAPRRGDGGGPSTEVRIDEIYLVDRPDLRRERAEFLRFLRTIRDIMDEVRRQDAAAVRDGRRNRDNGALDPGSAASTYQIYLWDEAQLRHLTRLASRHLTSILADPRLRDLVWLFPPPELLARPEQSARRSPITLVAEAAEAAVAAPIPHHYTLLELVATYRPLGLNAPSVHPLYQDPLSDLIPGERIHQYWSRGANWREVQDTIVETARAKIAAVGLVISRIERDIGRRLPASRLAAPTLNALPARPAGLSPHGKLWYEFTRLNAALSALEAHQVHAMPPHEREARFKSAILSRRLEGAERVAALGQLGQASSRVLPPAGQYLVYELAPDSLDVNVRDGDLGYALSPLDNLSFLDLHPYQLVAGLNLPFVAQTSVADSGLTGVSIAAIDRPHGLIALEPGRFNQIATLEAVGRLDPMLFK